MRLKEPVGGIHSDDLPLTLIFVYRKRIRYLVIRPRKVMIFTFGIITILLVSMLMNHQRGVLADLVKNIGKIESTDHSAQTAAILSGHLKKDLRTARQALLQEQLDELLHRQERLSERDRLIGPLSTRAKQLQGVFARIPVPTPRPEWNQQKNNSQSRLNIAAYVDSKTKSSIPWPIQQSLENSDEFFHAMDQSLENIERSQMERMETITSLTYRSIESVSQILDEAGFQISDYSEHEANVPLLAYAGSHQPFEIRAARLEEALNKKEKLRTAILHMPLSDPLPGADITSHFGNRRDPILRRPSFHAGIDFRAPSGALVLAAAAGVVVHAGWTGSYGRLVEIDHGNGLHTRYAHLGAVLVKRGDTINNGGVLGRVGSTGRSTGPHLHYEIRRDGNPLDPLKFINLGKKIAELI